MIDLASILDFIGYRCINAASWMDPLRPYRNGRDIWRGFLDVDKVVMKDGSIFWANEHSQFTLFDTYKEYNLSDIDKDDIVLDIGANIGGFTVQAARKAKEVYCLEPLYCDEIMKNLVLNNLSNVHVISGALGEQSGETVYTEWAKRENHKTPVFTFYELIDMCGGYVDFLKCDCEGAERYLPLPELKKIPKIEIELHFPKEQKIKELREFLYAHWVCRCEGTSVVHARKP